MIGRILGFLVLAAAVLAPAHAQDAKWPTKPVRFIVPFPPGGSVDPLARLIGARLSNSLGQQFIVDNRTGGSGSIGTAITAKSAPDGYTYLFVFDTHAVNPSLIPNMPFDTVKDLAPVMLIGSLFVLGLVFFSWLEERSLVRTLGHRTAREPKAMRWIRKKLGADLGRPPRVPWLLAAVFVALPFAMLLNLVPVIAAILLALLVAAPVAYARLDR